MKTNELYHRAIETYGIRNQWAVAVEELAELQKEICKMLRGGGDIAHLAEEIADAKIMIEQLIIIFDVKEMVEDYRRRKLERLERRLNDGE